jgi:hypothetical protein
MLEAIAVRVAAVALPHGADLEAGDVVADARVEAHELDA